VPTVGAVTIGQSPRDDLLPEIAELLPPGTRVIERGALDTVAFAELGRLAPAPGEDVLVTRLRNEREVRVAEARLRPLLRSAVSDVFARGADLVAVLCTGTMPGLRWPPRVLLPGPIVRSLVTAVTGGNSRLAVVVPASDQEEAARVEWGQITGCLQVVAASPYRGLDEIKAAARAIAGWHPDLVVLDCLGFDRSMQRMVRDTAGTPVLLPRTALAGAIAALL
jgi:protein AroM